MHAYFFIPIRKKKRYKNNSTVSFNSAHVQKSQSVYGNIHIKVIVICINIKFTVIFLNRIFNI